MAPRRALPAALLFAACAHASGKPAAPDPIDSAIAEMRGVIPDRLTQPQRDQKDKALDAAWKTLLAHKEAAAPRLVAALAADERAREPDHYFRMDASALLWDMQKLDAAPVIARALAGVDLGLHMDVGFGLFAQAAATRDQRAWPVVKHALRLDETSGHTVFSRHAMNVDWPLILEFIFSPYGPGVCAAAADSAGDADPRVQRSVLSVLVSHRCLEALPLARRLAASHDPILAPGAIIALGKLAHPDDRALLVELARHPAPFIRQPAAYALYEYGDPGTAPGPAAAARRRGQPHPAGGHRRRLSSDRRRGRPGRAGPAPARSGRGARAQAHRQDVRNAGGGDRGRPRQAQGRRSRGVGARHRSATGPSATRSTI
jgi:hypothetical protein